MSDTRILSSTEFKITENQDNVTVAKFCDTEIIKELNDEENRILTYKISTSAIDRESDTVSPKGWKLTAYRKNPIVLWNHLRYEPPIGRSKKVWVENEALFATAQYTPQEINPFGYMIYQLAKEGYTKGASVGFNPIKFEINTERTEQVGHYAIDYKSQELLEWSNVTIPANNEALQQARSVGIDLKPLKSWTEFCLDANVEPGPFMTRHLIELIHKSCESTTIIDTKPKLKSTKEGKSIMSVTEKFKKAQNASDEANTAALDALKELISDLSDVLKQANELSKSDNDLLKSLLNLKRDLNACESIKEDEPKKDELTDEDILELKRFASEEIATLLKNAMGQLD